MPKATRPVTIAGIEFDALISSDHTMEATVPEYATDVGFTVSDAIILKQETLSMVLYLTDTPVTWYQRHGKKRGRVKDVCTKLERLYYKAVPVKVVTADKTYTNMCIESIKISKSIEHGYAREIPISFRKIRQTKTKTAYIPRWYGKSGKTKTSTGTANTSSGTSGSGSSSNSGSSYSSYGSSSGGGGSSSGGGKSSGSGSSSSSKNSSGSSGSILYNAGSSLGIIKK